MSEKIFNKCIFFLIACWLFQPVNALGRRRANIYAFRSLNKGYALLGSGKFNNYRKTNYKLFSVKNKKKIYNKSLSDKNKKDKYKLNSTCIDYYNKFGQGKKVLVSISGVVPRGIKYSWPTIDTNIVNVLKDSGFEVDIHVFNIDTGDKLVDGEKKLDQEDVKLIPYKFYEEMKEEDIDIQIKQKCISKDDCLYVPDKSEKDVYLTNTKDFQLQNVMRQLYAEKRSGDFILKNSDNYDLAMFITPDNYFLLPLRKSDLIKALNFDLGKKTIFATDFRDSNGYGNGFYYGAPENLARILKRYDYQSALIKYRDKYMVTKYFTRSNKFHYNYEIFLRQAFLMTETDRSLTPALYCKKRANNSCYLNPSNDDNFKKIIDSLNEKEQSSICNSYLNLKKEGVEMEKVPSYYISICKKIGCNIYTDSDLNSQD